MAETKMETKAVYSVIPTGEGKKDFWFEIGRAFDNKDGSITILLNAYPKNGKLIVSAAKKETEKATF